MCSSREFSLVCLVIKSWLGIRFGKFDVFGKVMWVIKAVFSGLGTFVEESGQERYWAHVVAGGFAVVLQVGLGVSHVGPEVGVGREHVPVLTGLGTLDGKLVGEGLPSQVQSLLIEGEEG